MPAGTGGGAHLARGRRAAGPGQGQVAGADHRLGAPGVGVAEAGEEVGGNVSPRLRPLRTSELLP